MRERMAVEREGGHLGAPEDLFVLGLPKGRFMSQSMAVARSLGVLRDQHPARRASFDTTFSNWRVAVKLLKIQDIAALLREGQLDFGVCSDEWMNEACVSLPELVDLKWCLTKVVYAAPRSRIPTAGAGAVRVATPYPNLARSFFAKRGMAYHIQPVMGCPEALVPELCDVVIDCVETGRSLEDNELVAQETILVSSIRLYAQRRHERTPVAAGLAALLSSHVAKS
jgi:ATP phosphoribosyltransferase